MSGKQKGYTLVEVLVALALLSVVGIALYGALSSATVMAPMVDEKTTAEDLAERQMELVMSTNYDPFDPPEYEALTDVDSGYTVEVEAERLDSENDGLADDDGLQMITVTVRHDGELITTLEGYKLQGW